LSYDCNVNLDGYGAEMLLERSQRFLSLNAVWGVNYRFQTLLALWHRLRFDFLDDQSLPTNLCYRAIFARTTLFCLPRLFRAPNKTSTPAGSALSQLRVLRFGFLQDGDVGVGVFPETEELLVSGAGLRFT
jgi:hypothetical protein